MLDERQIERFWSHVDKKSDNECWEWIGGKMGKGYGMLFYTRGRSLYAHRMSYEIHYGEIPEGFFVCHKCDNPPCVNPAHLWAATPKENTQDAIKKGRRPDKKEKVVIPRRRTDFPFVLKALTITEMIEMRNNGYTYAQIGKILGVSRQRVHQRLNKQV